MSEGKFIVWHDTIGGNAAEIECLSYEGEETAGAMPPLAAGDFAIIHDAEQTWDWMAQVVEPQRNVPLQGLSRESPSEVAVFERILKGDIDKSIFLNQVYYYRLQLTGEILENGRLTAVRRRPRAGSIGCVADAAAVRKALDLPATEHDNANVIGRIHSSSVPIAVDWGVLRQHILVAGATGSGKSNTVANLVKASQSYGACVVVYDQKPDYQHMANPNDEVALFGKWEPSIASPKGLEGVARYCLWQGDGERGQGEQAIAVRACDVPLSMLVNALFHYPDEGNQRDVFQALVRYFIDKGNKDWSLSQFAAWVRRCKQTGDLSKITSEQGWGELNELTLSAMQRKMLQRRPKWLDALDAERSPAERTGVLKAARTLGGQNDVPTGYFVPKDHLAAGKIVVIRTNAEGREYGLFLSYMLQEIFKLRQGGDIKFPVVNIVDEAQDIFQGSAGVRESATARLNEVIRKGRSKDIGFVVAVQSVSQVPDSVLTNMNTRIVHRQNSVEELRIAIPSASRDLMATSLTFGPGEALVGMIGARSVVQAELAPSPFELSKTSAPMRRTLADQDEEFVKAHAVSVIGDGHSESADDLGDDLPF